jgi:hypothetical protein
VSRKNVALFGVLFGFSFLLQTHGGAKPANHLLRISAIKPILATFLEFDGIRQLISNKLFS